MTDDVDEHVAMAFHGLVSDLQQADVARFEAEQKRQAEQRAALRAVAPRSGLNVAELLKSMGGDPEEAARKTQAAIDKIERQAKEASDAATRDQPPSLSDGHFPPPPVAE